MAHEITETDHVVLNTERAWHGLGRIFTGIMTPRQAITEVAPWTAIKRRMSFRFNDQPVVVEDAMINVRSDNGEQLGVVTEGYQNVQPLDLADFANALLTEGQEHKVEVETAGTIRGGKRIWLLLKGEAFGVANHDEIFPYIMISNGYDGATSFRVTPTTVRTVCSNTLHASIPNKDTGELHQSAIAIHHTENVMTRVEEAKKALANYGKALAGTKELANVLAGKPVDSETVQKFFLECYTAEFGDIPENPKDGFEERRRNKAMSAYNSFTRRFDDEKGIAGASMWNAANAFSGLVQHDLKGRGQDDTDRYEKRVESNLFGLNQDRTFKVFGKAFKMTVAG